MTIVELVGRDGVGELMVALVPELAARGLRVSTIAYDGADAIDRPGKDSFRHRAAGAGEVMVTSARRWALIGGDGTAPPAPGTLAARMTDVDVVLVAGGGGGADAEIAAPAGADVAAVADAIAARCRGG